MSGLSSEGVSEHAASAADRMSRRDEVRMSGSLPGAAGGANGPTGRNERLQSRTGSTTTRGSPQTEQDHRSTASEQTYR